MKRRNKNKSLFQSLVWVCSQVDEKKIIKIKKWRKVIFSCVSRISSRFQPYFAAILAIYA